MEHYGPYVNAEVLLDHNDTQLHGVVKGRKWEQDGTLRGKANANPILGTRVYYISFPDGTKKEYAANVIYKSMWAQVDSEGNEYILLDLIIDHKKTSDEME